MVWWICIVGIALVFNAIIRSADRSDEQSQRGSTGPSESQSPWVSPDQTRPRAAYLRGNAFDVETAMIMMAGLEDRGRLDQLSKLDLMVIDTDGLHPPEKAGEFAVRAYALDELTENQYRSVLLSAMMNSRYSPATSNDETIDPTAINLCFGFAVLSQNTMLDRAEEHAWRQLLMSKTHDIFETFDDVFHATRIYYKQTARNKLARAADITKYLKDVTDNDYIKSQRAEFDQVTKDEKRITKQLGHLETLHRKGWMSGMSSWWAAFKPIKIEDIEYTKVTR